MNAAADPALGAHIAAYLDHWRSLGRRYRQEEWLLRTMARELPALGYHDLTEHGVSAWFESRRHLHANTRRKWAQLLRHFCVFRRRADAGRFVPAVEMPVVPVRMLRR